jgi:hypothetical protein
MPSNMESNLKRWEEQLKTGILQTRTLLKTDKETLNRLTHESLYKHLIIERLNDHYAIVSPELFQRRIMEESGIFLYPESHTEEKQKGYHLESDEK